MAVMNTEITNFFKDKRLIQDHSFASGSQLKRVRCWRNGDGKPLTLWPGGEEVEEKEAPSNAASVGH